MRRQLILASIAYAALMLLLWFGFHRSAFVTGFSSGFLPAFISFALLLAPLWFFGFGIAEALQGSSPWRRVAIAGLLALPYFVFTLGTGAFRLQFAALMIAIPVLFAACLSGLENRSRIHWRDVLALTAVVLLHFTKLMQSAWGPGPQAVFSKLFLADIALYGYLIVRKLEGTGYRLVPTRSALLIGLREWAVYAPLGLAIGKLTGFIHFHAQAISAERVIGGVLATLLLIAIPEELFFRSILQNLLEARLGRMRALFFAAILFGFSHFNHGSSFNWKYVLLASIAGVFYGRAWRAQRQIFASVVTHTAVDVVWSLWFR